MTKFFIILLIIIHIFSYYKIMKYYESCQKNRLNSFKNTSFKNTSHPVVLQWNEFHWTDIIYDGLECPKKCFFTKQMKHESIADVIIIYFSTEALKEIPKTNNIKRSNVMVNFEAPVNGPYFDNIRKDFFNYTVTYRLDSNLPMPYDCLQELDGPNDADRWDDKEVDEAIASKRYPGLSLVSHCKTNSKRELVIEKIQDYMNVTRYGSCSGKQCPRDTECESDAIKSHYFYFAFENAVCLDYITEKLFRFRQLIVPIILDRTMLQREHFKLNRYVIAVSDFKSIKDLVSHLNILMKNINEYKKYFEWTKLYKKTNKKCVVLENFACKMCNLAWDVKAGYNNIIPDIQKWYSHKQCRPNYGKFIG